MPSSTGLRRIVLLILQLLGLALTGTPARADEPPFEQTLRAAYLYNFLLYAEWPNPPGEPLAVCLIGRSNIGRALDALGGRLVRGHPVTVRHLDSASDTMNCQLLYIGQTGTVLRNRVNRLHGQPRLLTVAEADDAEELQPIITLVPDGRRLAFDIDLTASRSAGLTLSAKLLRLARQVR